MHSKANQIELCFCLFSCHPSTGQPVVFFVCGLCFTMDRHELYDCEAACYDFLRSIYILVRRDKNTKASSAL